MSNEAKQNPLIGLIGKWEGDKGTDLAPKPEEDENNPYYETLVFEAIDMEISNSEEQELIAVKYHQTVYEKESNEMSHSETGFWIWDCNSDTIMCAFSIPRGLSLLCGGTSEKWKDGGILFHVSAQADDPNWGIVQSPFMKQKAKTSAFKRHLKLSGNVLSYEQETTLEIYGKTFAHRDNNTLTKIE